MERIAVIRPGALGDTILTFPALAALRAAFPRCHLTFVGHPAALSLLDGHCHADATVSIDDPALAPLFAPLDEPSAYLTTRFGALDLAVVWLHDHAPVVENLRRLGARAVVAAASRPAATDGRHVADYLVATLAPALGTALDPHLLVPRIPLTAADRAFAADFWQSKGLAGRPVAALHPGSGGRWKCWPAARFAALADHLSSRGIAILLVAGPADEEPVAAFAAAVRDASPVIASGLAIRELAAVLAPCAAYVGNDSGVSHLAAALAVPAVALYGPTDPHVWGIRGDRVAHLRAATLEALPVSDVLHALESVGLRP